VLLTVTTTHVPATDLGYLLVKHPDRVHSLALPTGTAYVCYPEATAQRCTAALLLDVDPRRLTAKTRRVVAGLTLGRYVNDRPYAASSLLAAALAELTGPFDLIGDVHGCRAELEALLAKLGWTVDRDDSGRPVHATHPAGRTAVFVGDLVDRGPDSPGVLRLVMGMVAAGTALCVSGNHEQKLLRKLRGREVKVSHGLAETLDQLAAEPPGFVAGVGTFLDGLISHYVLDGGRLVVAHAGLKEQYHGRASGRVRAFALYGDTTGETDEYGLPVRYPWAREYRGSATVVYGHTPTPTAEWVNNTICLDTGAVFGGALTALRYPEREIVSVPAAAQYYAPARPLGPAAREDSALNLNAEKISILAGHPVSRTSMV